MNPFSAMYTPSEKRTASPVPDWLWRRVVLSQGTQMAIDAAVAGAALVLAHVLRFDGFGPYNYFRQIFFLLPYVCTLQLGVNASLGVYRQIWKYTSIADGHRLMFSAGVTGGVLLAARLAFSHSHPVAALPIGAIVINFGLCAGGMMAARLSRRLWFEHRSRVGVGAAPTSQRVLLVGAGRAGVLAVREFGQRPDLGMEVCGFVDDDPVKRSMVIHGVKVQGGTADIPALVAQHRIDLVVITMASAPRRIVRRVVELCEGVPVPVRIVPGLYEILGNSVSFSNFRPVEIEDLLGRESIVFESMEGRSGYCADVRVLVTGGAGSIGRELCRQITLLAPAELHIFDKDENSVFDALQFLAPVLQGSSTKVYPTIGDLRMRQRLDSWFAKHRPEIVFHAAAHKHVPLMEANVCEAVMNNLLGTSNLLAAAERYGVRNCVMVSTDKAVNPTNVMGATKRIAELMFQSQARRHGAGCYSCVRFGNVLGSRGSVVPTFHEQIRNGGPVTVTDPEMTRYFMTIPEAVQLIIQAGSLGSNGEIFLLDMGEPVRILDLAKDMIRLSGLKLGEDIDIQVTGLRPGEKMHEELFRKDEVSETRFDKIFMSAPAPFDAQALPGEVEQLIRSAMAGDEAGIRAQLMAMGIGFHHALTLAAAASGRS